MGSARVNLLPREVEERNRERRNLALLGLAGAVVLAALAVGYVLQVNRVNDAQERLEETQAELAQARQEVGELEEFAALEERFAAVNGLLAQAMSPEASVAGILQDIAAVMPPDAQLGSLNVAVTGPGNPELGDVRRPFGQLTLSGETLRGHAPGLERFLLEFGKIAAFSDVFFTSSTVDDRGVSSFSAQVDLGPEILTGRYTEGLPEALR